MTATPITMALLALGLSLFGILQVAALAVVARRPGRRPGLSRAAVLSWALVPALVVGLLALALVSGRGAPW